MYAQVGLYDVQSGQPLRCFQEHGNPPSDLTFDFQGTKLLTAGQALILWNPRLLGPGEPTPQPLPALDGEQSRPYAEHQLGGAVSVVASKRRPWLIAAGIYTGLTGHANDVVEVDQATFQIKRELIRDLDGISCMSLSPDESTLAIGTDQGDILLYQVASSELIRTWKTPDSIPVRSLLFIDDQQLAAAGLFGDLVLIFDANSGKTTSVLHQKQRRN
jgi:WD40 repeat protein